MKPDITTTIAGIALKTPVLVASGTFGYGDELRDLVPLKNIGGIITKTVTLHPRPGNPPPRLAETASGLLNTIGLQNVGVERFIAEKWASLAALGVPVIVSVAGATAEEYIAVVGKVHRLEGLAGIELNLSCPNLKKKIVCHDESLVRSIVEQAAKISSLPVIAKLSPLVTDIGALALVAENAGAQALSLVNTFPGMAIDVNTGEPKLSTVTGGLSGPAIKPLALRCVWEVCRVTKLPVIGGGGIMTAEDAVEFLLAGADAVSVGTASFVEPAAAVAIAGGIRAYLSSKKLSSLGDIVGRLKAE